MTSGEFPLGFDLCQAGGTGFAVLSGMGMGIVGVGGSAALLARPRREQRA